MLLLWNILQAVYQIHTWTAYLSPSIEKQILLMFTSNPFLECNYVKNHLAFDCELIRKWCKKQRLEGKIKIHFPLKAKDCSCV